MDLKFPLVIPQFHLMNHASTWKIFPRRREHALGFAVAFRVCAGMQTEIRDATENFGEEIFLAKRERDMTRLISDFSY